MTSDGPQNFHSTASARVIAQWRHTLTIHNTDATVRENRIELDYGRKVESGEKKLLAGQAERWTLSALGQAQALLGRTDIVAGEGHRVLAPRELHLKHHQAAVPERHFG